MLPPRFARMLSSSPSDGSRFAAAANQKWLEPFGDRPWQPSVRLLALLCQEQSVSRLLSLPLQSWMPLRGRLQAERLGVLCSCRVFPADLGPGTGAGFGLEALAVLPLRPGCRDPASRAGLCSRSRLRGKPLSFHLSRLTNKFTRSRCSWLGPCHTGWSPVPPASITQVLRVGSGQRGEMLCPPARSGLGEMLWWAN